MAIDITWHDTEKTIVLLTYDTGWAWSDFDEAIERSYQMILSVHHRVDVISWNQNFSKTPPGNPLVHFRQTESKMPRNLGLLVIVGVPPIAQVLFPILQRVSPVMNNKLTIAGSLQDATALIQRKRSSQDAASQVNRA